MTGPDAPRKAQRDVLDRLGMPMPGPAGPPNEAVAAIVLRITSLVWWFLMPTVVVAGLFTPGIGATFWAILAFQLLWKATTTVAAAPRIGRRPPAWLSYGVDLAALCALVAASGGTASPLRVALIAVPFAGGFLLTPRAAAVVGAGTLGAYLIPAAPDLLSGTLNAPREMIGVIVSIMVSAVAGVAVAVVRDQATAHVHTIDAGRRRLLATGMGAEDRERRRVSQQLHGDALQQLLAAAQDLDERTPEALRRAREGVRAGIAAVRDTVRDLHPTTLRHGGLEPALRAALEHRARNVVAVRVLGDVDARRENLLLALVREIGDVLSGLELDDGVAARIATADGRPVLTLSTTCCPASLPGLESALRGCAERVSADGGRLSVSLGPDGRALITARLGRVGDGTVVRERRHADELEWRSQLVFSIARVLLPPAGIVVALVSGEPTLAFYVLLALGVTYDAATIAVLLRLRRWRLPVPWLMSVATLCSAAAITQQGDATTPLAASALSVPFLLTMTFTPRGLALLSGLALCVLAVGFAPSVLDGTEETRASAFVLLAAYAWAMASSVVMATGRARLLRRRAALEQGRRRLLHDGLSVADAERRRLSEALHDGALQELLLTGQDIDEAIDGDAEALVKARVALRASVDQLRDAVTDLHPPALEHGGLRPALTSVVERACRRSDVAYTIEVDPRAPGGHDELVINLVRELTTNVCKHARAEHLVVTVGCAGGRLELAVRDDGVGASHARIAAAVAEGHIGLAASRERVEAEGGTLRVDSVPGGGTTVTALLPLAEPASGATTAG